MAPRVLAFYNSPKLAEPKAGEGLYMEYVRFNKVEEVKNVLRGKKTRVNPYVLLRLIADDYLCMHKKRKG